MSKLWIFKTFELLLIYAAALILGGAIFLGANRLNAGTELSEVLLTNGLVSLSMILLSLSLVTKAAKRRVAQAEENHAESG